MRKSTKGGDFYNTAAQSARVYCDIKKYISVFIAILCILAMIYGIIYRFSKDKYSPEMGGGQAIAKIKNSIQGPPYNQNNKNVMDITLTLEYNVINQKKIQQEEDEIKIIVRAIDPSTINTYKIGNNIPVYYDNTYINPVLTYTSPSTISNIILIISLFIFVISMFNYFLLQTDIGCGFSIAGNTIGVAKSIWSNN